MIMNNRQLKVTIRIINDLKAALKSMPSGEKKSLKKGAKEELSQIEGLKRIQLEGLIKELEEEVTNYAKSTSGD